MRALVDFLESRLGLVSLFRSSLAEKRPPRTTGWLHTLGFAALTTLILQFCSGIALASHYVPAAELAYDSIRALEQDVPYGAFVRSLHHIGASAMVVFVLVHMARVFASGAYKAPRELTWLSGVGLLVLVLAFGFTGYLLPWDQKAFFATKVGTEIAGHAPLVGATLRTALNGGDEVGPPTLTRFYVIHVVLLPLGLLGLLALHMLLIQKHGVAGRGRPVGDEGEQGAPYFPHHTAKEAAVGALVAIALFAWAARAPAPLEALAEPSDSAYQPRPDWYFLGLFQLLKYFKGPFEPIGAFWLPNGLLVLLALLPFLDRSPARGWRQRPLVVGGGACVLLAMAALTVVGALDAPKNPPVLPAPLGLTGPERQGYLLLRRLECLGCHTAKWQGTTYGQAHEEDPPPLEDWDKGPTELADFLKDPESEVMPDFAHVPYEDRRAIGLFVRKLQSLAKKP